MTTLTLVKSEPAPEPETAKLHVVMIGYDWQCGGYPDAAFATRDAAEAHEKQWLTDNAHSSDETLIVTVDLAPPLAVYAVEITDRHEYRSPVHTYKLYATKEAAESAARFLLTDMEQADSYVTLAPDWTGNEVISIQEMRVFA